METLHKRPIAETFARDGFAFPFRALGARAAQGILEEIQSLPARKGIVREALLLKAHLVLLPLLELARSPAILDVIEEVLGPDIMILSSQFWPKSPGSGRYAAWHQDSVFTLLDRPAGVQCWVALTDSTTANGCVEFLPGSHAGGNRDHFRTEDERNMVSYAIPDIDDSCARSVELLQGEFSVHDLRTIHHSHANSSARARLGYSILFVSAEARVPGADHSTLLVRGRDTYGGWQSDPIPTKNGDPAMIKYSAEYFLRHMNGGVVESPWLRPRATEGR